MDAGTKPSGHANDVRRLCALLRVSAPCTTSSPSKVGLELGETDGLVEGCDVGKYVG